MPFVQDTGKMLLAGEDEGLRPAATGDLEKGSAALTVANLAGKVTPLEGRSV